MPNTSKTQPLKGVVLDTDSLHLSDLNIGPLQQLPIEWQHYASTTLQQLHSRLSDAHIIISNKVVLNAATLQQHPSLQLICVAATGTNNIDTVAAKQQGITVCNAVGYSTPSVVQHTMALMLSLWQQLPHYQCASIDGRWSKHPHFSYLNSSIAELAGKRLGIIGWGHIGQAVAKAAQGLGLNIIVSDRPNSQTKPTSQASDSSHPAKVTKVTRVPFAEVLRTSDIISLHCPLTEHNRHLINRASLSHMQSHALLINCARGDLVHEGDLLEALNKQQIGGAGLDVLSQEPPAIDHPLLSAAQERHNLIITPHMAWASQPARQRLIEQIADNIQAFLDGNPIRRVE